MPALGNTIRVEGLRDLQRALKVADTGLHLDFRTTLVQVATPVRVDAESLALFKIRRIGLTWWQMRVGATQAFVYVAPKKRGVKRRGPDPRRRPNLASLLRDRALDPALVKNVPRIRGEVEDVLNDVARKFNRG